MLCSVEVEKFAAVFRGQGFQYVDQEVVHRLFCGKTVFLSAHIGLDPAWIDIHAADVFIPEFKGHGFVQHIQQIFAAHVTVVPAEVQI